jgi:putative ABC transport system permease protein
MLTPKLAFRNLLAHGQRNRVTFIAVGLVSCIIFLFLAFSDGEMENLNTGMVALTEPSSDIVVYATGFKAVYDQDEDWKRLSDYSIKSYPDILGSVRALPFIRRAGVPTSGLVMNILAAGERHENFFMRGVDPTAAWFVKDRVRITEGEFLDASNTPQIILHYKTAPTIKVPPGGTVRLSGKDLFGQVVVQEAVLAGYFKGEQDQPSLGELGFMNMAAYHAVSGFAPDETMSLLVDVKKGENVRSAINKLRRWARERSLPLEFWDSNDIPKSLRVSDALKIYSLFRLILQATSVIILLIVTFGIMNVISVNLYDRKREIGTYYCLGSEKGFLVNLYTLEILMLNLASTIVGVLAGLGVRQIINSLGLRSDASALQLVFAGSQFILGFSAGSVLFVIIAMVVVTLLTAVTTLGKGLRVSPATALRETE